MAPVINQIHSFTLQLLSILLQTRHGMAWSALMVVVAVVAFCIYDDKRDKRDRQTRTYLTYRFFWDAWQQWANTRHGEVNDPTTGEPVLALDFWQYVHNFVAEHRVPDSLEFTEMILASPQYRELERRATSADDADTHV
jgi:hypothetical protein